MLAHILQLAYYAIRLYIYYKYATITIIMRKQQEMIHGCNVLLSFIIFRLKFIFFSVTQQQQQQQTNDIKHQQPIVR